MIEKIRQYSETWWFKTFLGLIALTFVLLWGGGDLLNQIAGNRQTVANVGETRLTSWEFERAFNRELNHLSRRLGHQLTHEEAYKGGLHKSVLKKLIDETLVELEAQRLGLYVSDEAVRDSITKNTIFHNQEGVFNKEHFLHLLSRLGYTESGFIEEMRRDMMRTRLFQALLQGLTFPKNQARLLYRWQEQTRQLSYVVADFSSVNLSEKPTPRQLEDFFQKHKEGLRAPEFRDVTALIIDANQLASSIKVSPEDLRKAFEERASEFEGKTFDQVKGDLEKEIKKTRSQEKAYEMGNKVEDMLAGGSTLSEVAKHFSLILKSLKSIDSKGQSDLFKTKDGSALEIAELDKAIASEGFALDPDSVGSVIEVSQGLFFVAQTNKVYPARERSQKDVHPEYAQYLWKQSQEREKLLQVVEELRKSAGDRGRLAIAANKHKVRLQSVKVSREGAAIPSSLKLTPKLLNDIFTSKRNDVVVGLLMGDPQKPSFLVGTIESIHYPSEKGDSEEFKTFFQDLSEVHQDDFIQGYISSLRQRFAVTINQRFMKALDGQHGTESS